MFRLPVSGLVQDGNNIYLKIFRRVHQTALSNKQLADFSKVSFGYGRPNSGKEANHCEAAIKSSANWSDAATEWSAKPSVMSANCANALPLQ